MRHGFLIFVSSILLVAVLALTGCVTEQATPSPAVTAAPVASVAPAATSVPAASPGVAALQNKEPINIGYIGALSAPYGVSNKTALEISVEELNKVGGILGRPVNLIVEDWKAQVPLAVAAYKKLVMTDKCLVVFTEGTDGTIACAEEGAKLYSEYPHLLFANWSSEDSVTDVLVCESYDKYKMLFRPYAKSGDWYDPKMEQWKMFTDIIGTKKMALVIEDASWARPHMNGIPGKNPPIHEWYTQKGIEIVYNKKSAMGEKMFLPMLEEIASTGADTIYWMTGYTDSVTLVKQWAQSAAKDMNLSLVSGACTYKSFWEMTDGASLGVTMNSPEVDIPYTEYTVPFLQELRARGAGLMACTYGAYDGPWILKAAADKVGDTKDVDALIKALETVEAQHGFWKWKFDECHDAVNGYPNEPMTFGQWQGDGKLVMVAPDVLRKMANPNDEFIPVVELRKQAGQ